MTKERRLGFTREYVEAGSRRRNVPGPNDANRKTLASYIAHAVMYNRTVSPHDLVAAYGITLDEAKAILADEGGFFGPNGQGFMAFRVRAEKALKSKEWFSAPDPKAIPGAGKAYGQYAWLLENAAPKNTDQGRKDQSDIEDLQRQLNNVGFNGWGLYIDNWPDAERAYNDAERVYRPHRRANEARESHRVADFNTVDDLIAHARDELGATYVLFVDEEVHLYFPRRDGTYEKAEVWQKGGYWHAQGPGARTIVQKIPAEARPIGGGRGRRAAAPREVQEFVDPALIEAFADDVNALRMAKGITTDQAFDQMNKPAWFRKYVGQRPEDKIDLENRIINKAKSIGRRGAHEPHLATTHVRDYIAVDTRGRTIAGPFKSFSDAKGAAGPGGHVEYVRETGTAGVFEVDEAGGGFYTEAPNNGHRVAIGGRGEVIPSRRWKNKRTGATASPYGAVPWTGAPGDRKEDWELENVGWTIQWADGTTGIGRIPFPTREEAEDWLERDRARREAARRALPPWEPPKRTKRRAREARPRPKARRSARRKR